MNKIWKNIVAETQDEVKATFSEVYASLDFAAYIAPQDYFVSYIFETEEALKKAKEIGLLQIKSTPSIAINLLYKLSPSGERELIC